MESCQPPPRAWMSSMVVSRRCSSDLIGDALIAQQRDLRGDDFEEIRQALAVTGRGNVHGLLRGLHGFVVGGGLVFEDAETSEGIFDLLEGGQDLLAVVGD